MPKLCVLKNQDESWEDLLNIFIYIPCYYSLVLLVN